MNLRATVLHVSALATCIMAQVAAAQVFRPIGALEGVTYSYVQGLSADGRTAVGLSDRAFRWTPDGGMQALGTLTGGVSSQAWSASDDQGHRKVVRHQSGEVGG
jgi:uncharacterized membrane protein